MDVQHVGAADAPLVAVAKRLLSRPKVRVAIALWLVGLYIGLYATAPVQVTPQQEERFLREMQEANDDEGLVRAMRLFSEAEGEMYHRKVWFWYFRPTHRARVEAYQPHYDQAEAAFDKENAKRVARERAARAEIGIWSEYGIGEARERFWQAFSGGKSFAKRQTFFDAIFMPRSGDEGIVSFLISIVISFLVNLIIGLVAALFAFAYELYHLAWEYQTTLWQGFLFFFVGMLGAWAIVASYIGAIAGVIGGTGYMMVRSAQGALGPQGDRRNDPARFLAGQQRGPPPPYHPHAD